MEPLQLQHINVKIFLEDGAAPDLTRVIGVFHRWIAESALPELLIDVANYAHVPAGPRILLVGLEADYGLDDIGGRYGLRYNRKAPLDGGNDHRLRDALRSAARACLMLEREPGDDGALRFSRGEMEILINDRALAPNTEETWAVLRPLLQDFLERTLGHADFKLTRDEDRRRRLGAVVKSERPFDLNELAAS